MKWPCLRARYLQLHRGSAGGIHRWSDLPRQARLGWRDSINVLDGVSRSTGVAKIPGGKFHTYVCRSNGQLPHSKPCHTASAATRPPLMHCRPDRQRWRPFPALSGGQQALATLALCFALQVGSRFCGFDLVCLDEPMGWLSMLHNRVAWACPSLLPASLHVRLLSLYHTLSVRELAGASRRCTAAVRCTHVQAAFPSPFYFFDEIDARWACSAGALCASFVLSVLARWGC